MTALLESVHKRTRRQTRDRARYTAKPRVYISVNETILENLINRRSRPVSEYRRLMPQVMTLLGLPADTKAVWSQKAGCSCGCSPGFIVQYDRWDARWDAWVSVYN